MKSWRSARCPSDRRTSSQSSIVVVRSEWGMVEKGTKLGPGQLATGLLVIESCLPKDEEQR